MPESGGDEGVLERRMSRRFQVSLVFEGAAVGLLGGAVVTLYRLSLSMAETGLRVLVDGIRGNPAQMLLWLAALALILLVVGRLMLWEPYTVGSGIPQVDAEVAGRLDMPWPRVMGAKFAEGTLCTLAGLSLGREGPAVQLGGMAGKAVSKALGKRRGEERILVTCGAAAGMAAAFHAPLTGVMFALEEIHKVFTAPLIISAMAASVVSDLFVSQVLGLAPILSFSFASDLPHIDYLLVVFMGIVMGIVGAAHNRGMFLAQDLYSRIGRHTPYARLAIPFALAWVVAFWFPDLLCGGDAIVRLLEGPSSMPLALLVLLLVGKYAFTTACFGSGAPGGTLFPLVVMGALAGMIFGRIAVAVTGISDAYVMNFLVLGIAALFAGVVRAPITAIVLVFELTGSLDSLLSVSVVAITAYVTANLLRSDPFYEHLLAGLLGTTEDDETVLGQGAEKLVHVHMVETGSFVEGRMVRDVRWPGTALVVTITRGGIDIVPKGDTKILALDRLLVIMDAETEGESERRLRSLCRGTLGYGRESAGDDLR